MFRLLRMSSVFSTSPSFCCCSGCCSAKLRWSRKKRKKKNENRKMKTLRYTRQTIFFFNIFTASNWLDFLVFRLIEYLIAIPRIRMLMARTNREKAHVVASRKKQYVVVSVSGFTLRGNCREEKNLVQDSNSGTQQWRANAVPLGYKSSGLLLYVFTESLHLQNWEYYIEIYWDWILYNIETTKVDSQIGQDGEIFDPSPS